MTEEEMARVGVVGLTEALYGCDGDSAKGGKLYVRRADVSVVEVCTWTCGTVYFVHMGNMHRYVFENPFLLGEW